MTRNQIRITLLSGFALVAALIASRPVAAQDAKEPYPNMAPIEQYLMDRDAEIALARSASPDSISRDAEVLVLGRQGFETAVKGKNGFVCLVERSWTSAADPDFWNPKVRTPICYNAASARSYIPRTLKRTGLILAGRTKAQTDEFIAAAVEKQELPAMEPGAMSYMMSKQGYGGDSVEHWPPHVMFYSSQTDPAAWGAGLPGSPIFASNDTSEHLTEFVVAVQRWSDGTEDCVLGHHPAPTRPDNCAQMIAEPVVLAHWDWSAVVHATVHWLRSIVILASTEPRARCSFQPSQLHGKGLKANKIGYQLGPKFMGIVTTAPMAANVNPISVNNQRRRNELPDASTRTM
jgi:hypothetical protein